MHNHLSISKYNLILTFFNITLILQVIKNN